MTHSATKHNIVASVSFLHADTAMRDGVKFLEDEIREALNDLKSLDAVDEASILSTCNRTEIYLTLSQYKPMKELLVTWWAKSRKIPKEHLDKVVQFAEHGNTITHLFRVASSLESMVVGEGQILSQVKSSYSLAQNCNSIGLYQNKLFQQAIAIGKRVRTETEINQGAVSISFAAVELVKKVYGRPDKATVGIIGAGDMARLAMVHLKGTGVSKFHIVSRSPQKALDLASQYGAEVSALTDIDQVLSQFDIVISATAAPGRILVKEQVQKALKARSGKSMILVDIAAPRDLDDAISELEQALVFNIDDLKQVVAKNKDKRLKETVAAENIIEEGFEEYRSWYNSLEVVPAIRDLRTWGTSLKDSEFEKWKNRFPAEQQELLEDVLRSFLGKMLHKPSASLKSLAEEGLGPDAVYYLKQFFPLEES